LEHFLPLTPQDKRWLNDLMMRSDEFSDEFSARPDIIREGEVSAGFFVVTAGCACSYEILPDGGRQILDFIFPGDQTEFDNVPLQSTDHGIFALAPTAIAWIDHDRFFSELTVHPLVAGAFERSARQRVAILRERITSLGRRDAYARVAHLLCEMFERLGLVGEAVDYNYRLPVTQAELGDTLGLSEVHANRMLRRLERERLIVYEGRYLRIPDLDALKEAAGFSPTYLDPNSTFQAVGDALPSSRGPL
jgi:CRP-like cAMP-binding protein